MSPRFPLTVDSNIHKDTIINSKSYFTTLPAELIIHICSYLNQKDLQSVSLTSKRFSTIINESDQILDKLTAFFTSNSVIGDWSGTRKFKNFFIDSDGIETFLAVPRVDWNWIKSLSLFLDEIQADDFVDILRNCRNVKELNISIGRVESEDEQEHPHIELQLDRLWIGNDPKVMEFLIHCQILRLEFQWFYTMYSNELIKLLEVQKNLEILEIEAGKLDDSLNSSWFLENVKFRLKKLVLNLDSNLYVRHCWKFIEIHKKSLEYLELKCWPSAEVMEIFVDFKNLQEVNVEFWMVNQMEDFEDFPVFKQVETVKLIKSGWKAVTMFPNVKNLSIQVAPNQIVNLKRLKKLESLKVSGNFEGSRLEIPERLKILTLCDVDLSGGEQQIVNGGGLEVLVLKNVNSFEWIDRLVGNLKVLKIFGSKFNDDFKAYLKKWKQKVQFVKVYGPY